MDEHEKVEGLNEERKFEFDNFIGIYKNWFSPDNIEQFLSYYNYCESVGETIDRRKGEGSNLLAKADNAVSIGHQHEIHGDHSFIPFLQYINGYPLEHYNAKYPGFGRPLSIHCKIQKTEPGEGYHIWHCEHDVEEPSRVLAWSLFLNDVEEGGELEFLHQNLRFKPRKGDFLIWPAHFTHIHRGNPPISNTKYIATGWYEWIDDSAYLPLDKE